MPSPVTVRELPVGEAPLAFAAMRGLRPELVDPIEFTRTVDELQRPQGYRLVAAIEPGTTDAAAVAGFRVMHTFAWGQAVYVDDLATRSEARRRGHAGRLLRWIAAEGVRLGAETLHLDSAVGTERADAHRLYLNDGMRIASHHFARALAARDADPAAVRVRSLGLG